LIGLLSKGRFFVDNFLISFTDEKIPQIVRSWPRGIVYQVAFGAKPDY
jgi:hypothetical protein